MRLKILVLIAALGTLTACERYANYAGYQDVHAVTNGGNPEHGREVIRYYGCNTCHTIPGIRDANAVVGPPLDHMANRNIITCRTPPTTSCTGSRSRARSRRTRICPT
jgi:cytochrome c2